MNRKTRKALTPCFGTKEFNENSDICKRCQHYKACKKEQRTDYPELDTAFNPRWFIIKKKYRGDNPPWDDKPVIT